MARIHGPVRAGGLGIVAACDLAVASDEVTYAFTEARLGLAPAVISLSVLPRMKARAAGTTVGVQPHMSDRVRPDVSVSAGMTMPRGRLR